MLLLSTGLILCAPVSRLKLSLAFDFSRRWNPPYLISILVAIIFNSVSFNLISKFATRPLRSDTFQSIRKLTLSSALRVCAGSACLGVGTGLSSVTPTSMFLNFQFFIPHLSFVFFFAFIGGQIVSFFILKFLNKCCSKKKKTNPGKTDQPRMGTRKRGQL